MSRRFRAFYIGALAVIGVGLLATSFVPKAHADGWNKMTVVTVQQPIIAGNKVLDPGTYVWKLMDSPSDRHIVQIYDKDQRHLETTILAIPNYRLQPADHVQFAFWETPAGVPKAVRAWFYPGDNFGQEFPYPKKLVDQLASAAPAPQPAAYTEPEPQPQPEVQPAPVPEPEPQPTAAAQPEVPQPSTTTQPVPVQPEPAALPHTASVSPMVGLLGAACLSLAGLLSLVTQTTKNI
ncbi:MAG: hypothetical protein JOY54_14880 [Acidobacteriaceae bacterium]|nr:hypothetical protein [Acidobacteriaceae bacterium]